MFHRHGIVINKFDEYAGTKTEFHGHKVGGWRPQRAVARCVRQPEVQKACQTPLRHV